MRSRGKKRLGGKGNFWKLKRRLVPGLDDIPIPSFCASLNYIGLFDRVHFDSGSIGARDTSFAQGHRR